ncbi:MAG: hypothetical protein EXQ58_11500 [Acidobacteria bacterium]|nr:hypothetical protein [Acidobacteriota bacterium]
MPAARSYDNYHSLLADPAIEAVLTAVPIELNATILMEALHARKHVMAEKPICCAIRGQPQVGLRCFIWKTAAMISCLGPFGPGFFRNLGENSRRHFRVFRAWCKFNRVEGLSVIAERMMRAGRIKRAHKPATIRSDTPRCGARFRERLRITN